MQEAPWMPQTMMDMWSWMVEHSVLAPHRHCSFCRLAAPHTARQHLLAIRQTAVALFGVDFRPNPPPMTTIFWWRGEGHYQVKILSTCHINPCQPLYGSGPTFGSAYFEARKQIGPRPLGKMRWVRAHTRHK